MAVLYPMGRTPGLLIACQWACTLLGEGRLRRYKGWSEAVGKATASVAVLYASDYGFSDRLSQTLARGITKAGVATDMVDLLSADPQVSPVFCQLGPKVYTVVL